MKLENKLLISILITSLLSLLSLGQWYISRNDRRDMYHIRMMRQASRICYFIEEDIKSRMALLERTARLCGKGLGSDGHEFTHIAGDILEGKQGFKAIELLDSSYKVIRILPHSADKEGTGRDYKLDDDWLRILELSEIGQKSMISPLTSSPDKEREFRLITPLYNNDNFLGFMIAIFQVENWLSTIIHSGENAIFYRSIKIDVRLNNEAVFVSRKDNSPYESYSAVKQSSIGNLAFTVRCTPLEEFFEPEEKDHSVLILIIGFFFSLLIGVIIFLIQSSAMERLKKLEARSELKKEVHNRRLTEKEMVELNTRLQLATEAGRIGIWSLDLDSYELEWNDIMFELFGIPRDVIPNYEVWRNAVHPEDLPMMESSIENAVKGKKEFSNVFRVSISGEQDRIIRSAATVKRDPSGKALQITGVNWDISESKKAEEMLERQRKRLENILEGTNVGTWEWNIKTGETIFNERWAKIIGYTLNEISPVNIETWIQYTHPDDLKRSDELLQKHFSGELPYYECEARMKHKDGHWVWVLDRGKVTEWTPEGEALLMSGTHSEITERKCNEEKILHMAVHDALTDLPTLRLARDRLKMTVNMARRKAGKAAVMFIDLDGFKWINDSYGHETGDEVLIYVAGILRDCIRESDTAARIGGDEFLILLTEIHSAENAQSIAEKLVSMLSLPFVINGKGMTVSASIGIALFPENGTDPEELIRHADRAMYRIKNSGKNGFSFA